ncbi:hypothetical protein KUF73_09230 [Pseudomonas sp. PD9R]|nr:hypothetical protein [Pseudomonas sp. PD9R]
MFPSPQVKRSKKKVHPRILFTFFTVLFLAGCSDPNKEARGQFLAGCVQSGVSKSICSCAFEKLEEKYTPDQMKKLNDPMVAPPESFMRDVMNSGAACRNE